MTNIRMEEKLEKLEILFRNEMAKLQCDINWQHMRILRLQKDLRESQNKISSLEDKLAKRHENEKEIKNTIQKMEEESLEVLTECVLLHERMSAVESTGHSGSGSESEQTPMTREDGKKFSELLTKLPEKICKKFEDCKKCQEGRVGNMIQDEENTFGSSVGNFSPASDNDAPKILIEASHCPVEAQSTSAPCLLEELHNSSDDISMISGDHVIGTETNSMNRKSSWQLEHGVDNTDLYGLSCVCGIKLKNIRSLAVHIQHFNYEWKFSCTICDYRFNCGNKLLTHMQRVHEIDFGGVVSNIGCRKCGEVHESQMDFIKHLLYCGGGYARITTKAARILKRRSQSRTSHDINHSRLNTCTCGKRFCDLKALTLHVKYHTIKTHLCKFCGKGFPYNCYLKMHLLRAHKNLSSRHRQNHG